MFTKTFHIKDWKHKSSDRRWSWGQWMSHSSIDSMKGGGGGTWQLWSNNYVTTLDKLIIYNIILGLLYFERCYSTLHDLLYICNVMWYYYFNCVSLLAMWYLLQWATCFYIDILTLDFMSTHINVHNISSALKSKKDKSDWTLIA